MSQTSCASHWYGWIIWWALSQKKTPSKTSYNRGAASRRATHVMLRPELFLLSVNYFNHLNLSWTIGAWVSLTPHAVAQINYRYPSRCCFFLITCMHYLIWFAARVARSHWPDIYKLILSLWNWSDCEWKVHAVCSLRTRKPHTTDPCKVFVIIVTWCSSHLLRTLTKRGQYINKSDGKCCYTIFLNRLNLSVDLMMTPSSVHTCVIETGALNNKINHVVQTHDRCYQER